MDLDPFTSKFFTSLLLGKPESPIHNQLTDVRTFWGPWGFHVSAPGHHAGPVIARPQGPFSARGRQMLIFPTTSFSNSTTTTSSSILPHISQPRDTCNQAARYFQRTYQSKWQKT